MRYFNFLVFVFFVCILFACNKQKYGKEYMSDVETNKKLIANKKHKEYCFDACYRPVKYLAIKELVKHGSSYEDTLGLKNQINMFNKGLYFDVRISLKNKNNIITHNLNNQAEYAVRIDYLNNKIYSDFYIQTEDLKIIKPIGHCFQNTFGLGKSCDLTLVFPSSVLGYKGNVQLIYRDKIFGLKDKIRFEYQINYLRKYQS